MGPDGTGVEQIKPRWSSTPVPGRSHVPECNHVPGCSHGQASWQVHASDPICQRRRVRRAQPLARSPPPLQPQLHLCQQSVLMEGWRGGAARQAGCAAAVICQGHGTACFKTCATQRCSRVDVTGCSRAPRSRKMHTTCSGSTRLWGPCAVAPGVHRCLKLRLQGRHLLRGEVGALGRQREAFSGHRVHMHLLYHALQICITPLALPFAKVGPTCCRRPFRVGAGAVANAASLRCSPAVACTNSSAFSATGSSGGKQAYLLRCMRVPGY
jgi:hypothetical protein